MYKNFTKYEWNKETAYNNSFYYAYYYFEHVIARWIFYETIRLNKCMLINNRNKVIN